MTEREAELIVENNRLRNLLALYQWKDRDEVPPPMGIELLLYMKGGTMIQGTSASMGYTHWTRKPLSPGKQNGGLK